MAKQSGLHQIRGKVGEHSYYKQTGVSAGLIRGINQGMSARVKTGAEYANTRLNNQEFGAACDTAGLLGKCVTPKFRPMILPFSQSKMAKEVLRLARENSNEWGQRTITNAQTAQLAAVLSAQSKRDYSEFVSCGISFDSDNDFTASVAFTEEQSNLMVSLGIQRLTVTATIYNVATGQWNAMGHQMMTGYMEKVYAEDVLNEYDTTSGAASETVTLTAPVFVPAANHAGHQIVVFVIQPIREVGSSKYILQEFCSFVAFALPARS